MRKYILSFVLISLTMTAFSQNKPIENVAFYNIDDLNIDKIFKQRKYRKYYNKKYKTEDFRANYFYAWNKDKTTFPKSFASTAAFKEHFSFEQNSKNPCFKGNYQPIGAQMVRDLNRNINRNTFPNLQQYGMILEEANVREVPTDEFCFKRIRNAGESYPFDYFQYTTLWLGTPVMVMHQSLDEMWYFVASPYSTGWVRAAHIGLLTDKQKRSIQKRKLLAITKENVVLKTDYSVIKAHIGTLLPISRRNKVLVPRRTKRGKTTFDKVNINKADGSKMPLEFNSENARNILGQLVGNKYSWGGLGGGRDCSATLKDFMTPFGIWLPRNSSQQKSIGEVIDLEGRRSKKMKKITQDGIPFLTVIYKRGHSMLYIGENDNGVPLIFHNAWGLKVIIEDRDLADIADNQEKYGVFGISKRDRNTVNSRYIIGEAAITTVDPERDFPRSRKIEFDYFIDNISSMNIIVKK